MRLIISIITAVCILGAILVNATANEVIESPDEQKIICAETQSPECNDETEEQKEVAVHAHCSKICVIAGQEVKKGQVISYVGSTGRSTGNHLHLEVWKDGVRTNALDYFE